MSEPNWGLIRGGATFEALVATLVYAEDQEAALFGRPGPDGGQDMRSSDGALIYQAKFHRNESAALAIGDALDAAKAVATIRADSSHPRRSQWEGVREWKLVTNAPFGPSDDERWRKEVVPAFAALGIGATYWGQRDLNVRLVRNPEVLRSFFDGTARSLLTLPEAWDAAEHDVVFLPRALHTPLKGRDEDLRRVDEFLQSDARYLVVTGPGGVGKTRFLLEAGTYVAAPAKWQVLWANLTRIAGGDWYNAVVPERRTLLLVDEPQDEEELSQIVDELKNTLGRADNWKVAVTVRAPNDPVRRFLTSPRLARHTSVLELRALQQTASAEVVGDLIESGPLHAAPQPWKQTVAETLSKLYDRFPVWLSLAVELLERHGDLSRVPETAEGLASEYLDEVYRKQSVYPREALERTVQALALVRILNVEDPVAMGIVEELSGLRSRTAVLECLEHLLARRVLAKRGAYDRLIEIKPDVLRDQVLRSWLLLHVTVGGERWIPTDAATELIGRSVDAVTLGRIDQLTRSILKALARTETLFRIAGEEAPLLKPFFDGVDSVLSGLKASARLVVAQALPDVASARPESVARLVQRMRTNRCDPEKTESVFGSREVTYEDVLLELAWPVYLAARTSLEHVERKQVLDELCELVGAEHEALPKLKHGLPNDGKRAAQLVGQVVTGGPEFWSSFDAEVLDRGLMMLEQLHREGPTATSGEQARALLEPALSLERQWTTSDESTVTFSRHTLLPAAEGWKTRRLLVDRIRALLTSETNVETIIVYWKLLASAHHSANQAESALKGRAEAELLKEELLDDLEWTRTTLAARNARTEELSAARSIWDWHRRYDDDKDLRASAEQLEAFYLGDQVAGEFEALVEFDDVESHDRKAREKAAELANVADAAELDAFVSRAEAFLGRGDLRRVFHVAHALGALAAQKPAVATFVRDALLHPSTEARAEFAATVARRWLGTLRIRDSAQAFTLVKELVALAPDDQSKARLLGEIYWNHSPEHSGSMSPEEHQLLRGSAQYFLASNAGALFLEVVGPTFQYDWQGYRAVVEAVLVALPTQSVAGGFARLVHGVYAGVRWFVTESGPPPPDLFQWLLDLVVSVPDVDIGGNTAWYLGELEEVLGRASVAWLARAIHQRVELQKKTGKRPSLLPSGDARLTNFVRPVEERPTEDERDAIRNLLALRHEAGGVGYNLPQYLVDIDPKGVVVPGLVVELVNAHPGEFDELYQCARIGGVYALTTDAWCAVALSVIRAAQSLDQRSRISLFAALGDPRPRMWSGVAGEVPPAFRSAVEDARMRERENRTPELAEFWRWRRETAEAALARETEELKEENEQ